MLKTLALVLGLCFTSPALLAEEGNAVSFFDVAFKFADYSIDSKSVKLVFKDAYIKGNLRDVEIESTRVSVELRQSAKNQSVYTTLDIFDAGDLIGGLWYRPKRVVVVVRDKRDLKTWNKFLLDIEKKQEQKRKEEMGPVRVLPPIIM